MKDKKQDSVEKLCEMIGKLEVQQEKHGRELKDQLLISYESLKPLNLLKSSIKDLSDSVELKNGMVDSIISILSGYLTQRIIIRTSKNPIKRIMASFIQMGATSLVAKNIDFIKNLLYLQIDRLSNFIESRKVEEKDED
jgi:hypothetical protein